MKYHSDMYSYIYMCILNAAGAAGAGAENEGVGGGHTLGNGGVVRVRGITGVIEDGPEIDTIGEEGVIRMKIEDMGRASGRLTKIGWLLSKILLPS